MAKVRMGGDRVEEEGGKAKKGGITEMIKWREKEENGNK